MDLDLSVYCEAIRTAYYLCAVSDKNTFVGSANTGKLVIGSVGTGIAGLILISWSLSLLLPVLQA
jgi:hypothetical protein